MKNSYQLGPISISKSFVHHPFFAPGVIGIILVGIVAGMFKNGYLTFSVKDPEPSIQARVFPLNQQLGNNVLYAAGTTIYRTNGQTEESMFEVGSEVLSLVISDDGSKLAASYKHPNGGSNRAGYPYTSLIFYDMNTHRSLPLIADPNTTVRYPQWSDDNRYISFFVNDGEESFIYDTSRRRAIYSVKREDSIHNVSPITFLPNSEVIAYIKDNKLFTAAIDGSRAIALAEDVEATRIIDTTGNIAANTPIISEDGNYIAYYKPNQDLEVVQVTTRETTTIDEDVQLLGFVNNDELVYATKELDTKKTPGMYRYSLKDKAATKMSNRNSFLSKGTNSESAVITKQSGNMYLPSLYKNIGPQLVDAKSMVEQDCSEANFSYSYNNPNNDTRFADASQVVAPSGKYLLGTSDGSMAVLDTNDCQPYILSDRKASVSIWE
jgi:dipeptidyl aminopeptidase/acylaminoacyl peptidase